MKTMKTKKRINIKSVTQAQLELITEMHLCGSTQMEIVAVVGVYSKAQIATIIKNQRKRLLDNEIDECGRILIDI